jgi:hypothetical protein
MKFTKKLLLASILILFVAALGYAQSVPGIVLNAEMHKTWDLSAGFAKLDAGPNGDAWDADELAYEAKNKDRSARWASYDPRVAAFNGLNAIVDRSVAQWNSDCEASQHPNGLPTAQLQACATRRAALEAESNALTPQRNSLNAEKAQLDSEQTVSKTERVALDARADQYNTEKSKLIDLYNAQLVITQATFKAYADCMTATPTSCGPVSDFTAKQVAASPALAPRPPLAVGAGAFQGTWQGTWSGEGFTYNNVTTLTWGVGSTIQGQIVWTLRSVPEGSKYDVYRAKIGQSATEFVKGTVDEFTGYTKNDPQDVIGLDSYRLRVSRDKNTLSGSTYTNNKDWGGVFMATRVKQ